MTRRTLRLAAARGVKNTAQIGLSAGGSSRSETCGKPDCAFGADIVTKHGLYRSPRRRRSNYGHRPRPGDWFSSDRIETEIQRTPVTIHVF